MNYYCNDRKVKLVLVIFLLFTFIGGSCDNKATTNGKNTKKRKTTTGENEIHRTGKNGTDTGGSNPSVCTSNMALTFGTVEATPTTVGYGNTAFKYFYYHKDNKYITVLGKVFTKWI